MLSLIRRAVDISTVSLYHHPELVPYLRDEGVCEVRSAAYVAAFMVLAGLMAGSVWGQTGGFTSDLDINHQSFHPAQDAETVPLRLAGGGKDVPPPGPAPAPVEEPEEDPTRALGLVPFDHWAYDAVQMLLDQGIMIGYPRSGFHGDRPLTRYEFAMALSRLLDALGRQCRSGRPGG